MDIQYYWQFLQLKPDIINDLCQSMVQFKWQSNCRQFKWGWTVTILFQTDWKQTNGEVKKKISFEWGITATLIIEMDGNKQMVKIEKTFSDFSSPIPSLTLPSWRTMPPRGRTTSPWWTHFQSVEGCTYLKDSFYSESLGDFRLAKCLHCDKLVRRGKPGCTARETTNSGMASHMRTKHSGLALQVMPRVLIGSLFPWLQ